MTEFFYAFLKLGCVQRLLGVLDRGLPSAAVEYRQGVFTTQCRSMIRPNAGVLGLSALLWQQPNNVLAACKTLEKMKDMSITGGPAF